MCDLYRDDRASRAYLTLSLKLNRAAKLTEPSEKRFDRYRVFGNGEQAQARKSRGLRPYSCHVLGSRPKPSRDHP